MVTIALKKSRVGIFIEFYHSQNIERLESQLRRLVKKKQFPPFASLDVMVDHKGLKNIKYKPIVKEFPMVIDTNADKQTE